MSELKLNGKIKEILNVQTGTSKASGKEWKKLTFAIANNDGYEGKEVLHAFELFGEEKVDNFLQYNKVGKDVEVSYNQESKRWESPKGEIRYFTTNSAWRVFGKDAQSQPQTSQATPEEDDELPF